MAEWRVPRVTHIGWKNCLELYKDTKKFAWERLNMIMKRYSNFQL